MFHFCLKFGVVGEKRDGICVWAEVNNIEHEYGDKRREENYPCGQGCGVEQFFSTPTPDSGVDFYFFSTPTLDSRVDFFFVLDSESRLQNQLLFFSTPTPDSDSKV